MDDLTVTLIQTDLVWENIKANLSAFDKKIDAIKGRTDLIVLPEMFSTGFTRNVEKVSEDMNGPTVKWIRQKSRQKKADITGSVIIADNGQYVNRLLWAKPDGTLHVYDKRHLFRMGGEDKIFSSGDEHLTIELNEWKIRPFVCYDLRFPCWTRNIRNQYDMALFVANWPQKRAMHWKTLLRARAIENQCYVVGVNRVGKDGKGNAHSGDSSIIDPRGKILFQKHKTPCVHTETLSYSLLQKYRKEFPAWMDADNIRIVKR